jgi:hypothetical protein
MTASTRPAATGWSHHCGLVRLGSDEASPSLLP